MVVSDPSVPEQPAGIHPGCIRSSVRRAIRDGPAAAQRMDVPADGLHDAFTEFRTVRLQPLPLLRTANAHAVDGIAAGPGCAALRLHADCKSGGPMQLSSWPACLMGLTLKTAAECTSGSACQKPSLKEPCRNRHRPFWFSYGHLKRTLPSVLLPVKFLFSVLYPKTPGAVSAPGVTGWFCRVSRSARIRCRRGPRRSARQRSHRNRRWSRCPPQRRLHRWM